MAASRSRISDRGSETAKRALVEVDGVSVEYPLEREDSSLLALSEIDLDIHSGEFVTVLGPSGCGKTTLLNTIAGLVRPTSGEIRLEGSPIQGPGPDRAVVFQDYALLPWRTVFENVRFGVERQPAIRDDADPRIREVLELVGLAGFEGAYPRELSGGMQQRVGLARALIAEPLILLMDEPFGAVDAMTREVMRNELDRIISETGKTVVFITHSVDEAILLGDRVVVFSARPGRIREILPVDLPRPRYEYDARAKSQFVELREHLWNTLGAEAKQAAMGTPDGS